MTLTEDLDELHEHLPVGLQRGGYDVLAGAVAPAADGVAVVVPRGDLAQDLDVGIRARDVSRLAAEQDLDLGRQVYGADLAHDLLRVLVRQVADVEVVGTAVGGTVQDIPADDASQVHARVGKELVSLV